MRVSSMCRRAESMVLTPRNVQAFRTVYNITHALFEHLGPEGWRTVLSALSVLDEILCSPAATTLQKAATTSASPRARNSELSVLETATAQLFVTTAAASLEATLDIMHVLRELSESTGVFVRVCTVLAARDCQRHACSFLAHRAIPFIEHACCTCDSWDFLAACLASVPTAAHVRSMHCRQARRAASPWTTWRALSSATAPACRTSGHFSSAA